MPWRAALIDMIEKGNVAGAVAATNHHLSAIEERLMMEGPTGKACHRLPHIVRCGRIGAADAVTDRRLGA
jgi:hypothetical protein